MKRYDKVPSRQLRAGQLRPLLHVMTPKTALRWAFVERARRGHGYVVSAYDIKLGDERTIHTNSYRRAAVLAKRYAAREA